MARRKRVHVKVTPLQKGRRGGRKAKKVAAVY